MECPVVVIAKKKCDGGPACASMAYLLVVTVLLTSRLAFGAIHP